MVAQREVANQTQQKADYLRSLGFDVFPCWGLDAGEEAAKKPRVTTWKNATLNRSQNFRESNLIGVNLPPNTAVLDIDNPDLFTALGKEVPETFHSRSNRPGGEHHYFRTDGRPVPQETDTSKATGYDTRVGGKGYVIAWHPEEWEVPENWAPAPEWLYHKQSSKTEPLPSIGTTAATYGTRGEILSLLGSIARVAPLSRNDYLALLLTKRRSGEIVALDASRPWTDSDLSTLASEAAAWETITVGNVTVTTAEINNPTIRERTTSEGYPDPEDRSGATRSPQGAVEYVDDIVRAGRIITVAAEEGTGKSYAISGEMALRIATGTGQFAGTWPIKTPTGVLYLSEMHADDDYDRESEILTELDLTREDIAGKYYRLNIYTATDKAPLADATWVAHITDWCRTNSVKVMIFDTATNATDKDAWGNDFRDVFRTLRAMIEGYPDLAIILIVHMKKPSGKGGSRGLDAVMGEWGRWNDVTLMLENEGADFGKTKITARKRVRTQKRIIATKKNGLLVDPIDVTTNAPRNTPAQMLAVITANPGITVEEFGKACPSPVSRASAAKYIKTLGEAITVITNGPKNAQHIYIAGSPTLTAL